MINTIGNYANYFFGFSVPFTHIGGYLACLAGLILMASQFKKLMKHPIVILMVVFIVYGIVRNIFSTNPQAGWGAMAGYFSHWLLPFVLGFSISGEKAFNRAVVIYFITAFMLILFSVGAYMGIFPMQITENFVFLGTDGLIKGLRSHIALAAICLLLSYISISKLALCNINNLKERFVYIFFTLFFMAAIFLTGSRGYYIASMVSYSGLALYWLIHTGKWKLITAGTLSLFFALAILYSVSPDLKNRINNTGTSDNNVMERISLYKVAVVEIKARPLTGFGPGQGVLQKEYFDILPQEMRSVQRHNHLHSFYLNITADLGIIGLILFLAIIFALLMELWSGYKFGSGNLRVIAFGLFWGTIGILVGDCFDTLLRGPGTAMELFWLAGLVYGKKIREKINTNED